MEEAVDKFFRQMSAKFQFDPIFVGVHVRRGDYERAMKTQFADLCFFKGAMELMVKILIKKGVQPDRVR